MDINYEYYRIFYYVAKFSSFTRAANVLCSSQPNVTRTINKLEQALGCALFARTNRGVRLTPEGELLFAHVEIAVEQFRLGEEELSGSTHLQRGSLSVGVSETALNLFFPDKLREYHALYPNIQLRIYNYSTPQALSALRRGTADLVVVTTPTNAEKPLQETRLTPFRDILIGGRQYAALAGKPHRLQELEQYPLICLGRETMTYEYYAQIFLRHGLVLRPDTEAATTDQILPLVQCDLGLGFLPEHFAQEALAQGDVYEIPIVEPIPQRYICMVKDSRRTLSVAARAFEKVLCAHSPAETSTN